MDPGPAPKFAAGVKARTRAVEQADADARMMPRTRARLPEARELLACDFEIRPRLFIRRPVQPPT